MKYTTDHLWNAIKALRCHDAINVKRGYHIRDIAPSMQAAHLCEEAAELLQEVLNPNMFDRAATADEASHVLSVLLHLLIRLNIPLEEVCSPGSPDARKELDDGHRKGPLREARVHADLSWGTGCRGQRLGGGIVLL